MLPCCFSRLDRFVPGGSAARALDAAAVQTIQFPVCDSLAAVDPSARGGSCALAFPYLILFCLYPLFVIQFPSLCSCLEARRPDVFSRNNAWAITQSFTSIHLKSRRNSKRC